MPYNTLIVLLGTTLIGMNAGLVGSFAVLRGRAMLGDVLSHAALPGLCITFLIVMQRSVPAMLVGALVTCLVAVVLMTLLLKTTRVKDDALMGMIRSVFFGLGVVLITRIQNTMTSGSKAGFDSYILGKTAGMLRSDVITLSIVAVFSLVLIVLLYKELRLAAFDPGFARVQGWPAVALDIVQMALVAVATVVGLPAVGAILVAAMLILPGATMRFWTDNLGPMLIGAVVLGGAIGAGGTLLSSNYSLLPAGPIIILVGTTFFVVSMLVAPRRGLTARFLADRRYRRALRERKLLSLLVERSEAEPTAAAWHDWSRLAAAAHWNDSEAAHVLARAELVGLVERRAATSTSGRAVRLTAGGRRVAVGQVRAERLWAAYLDEFPDEAGSSAEYDPEALDAAIPADVRTRLATALAAAGRLPTFDEPPQGAGGSA